MKIRVLWLVSSIFPPLCKQLGIAKPTSGGWLYSAAKGVMETNPNIQLGFVCPYIVNEVQHFLIEGAEYFLVPKCGIVSYSKSNISDCKKVLDAFHPDFIHIHGSETTYAAVMCEANAGSSRILVNIQGLASGIARYADGGLSFMDKCFITPLDFLRGTFSFRKKTIFAKRGELEKFVLQSATDIAGRTRWDKAHVLAINPRISYYHLNETLRNSFYEGERWSYDQCDKHRIFVSNSNEPLKGTHQVIKALPLILREFPNTELYVIGQNVQNFGFKQYLHFTGYQMYLRALIKKLQVEDHIHFLGTLNEQQMREQYLKANVYVLPSSIENSSNSLSEAQILGTPAIGSYAGGTPSMIEDGRSGYLYRYDDTEELAFTICNIFSMHRDASVLSSREVKMAMARHDRKQNADDLVKIYDSILKKVK